MSKQIKNHANYDANDYAYLSAKGYSDKEILARWTKERKEGKGACQWNSFWAKRKLASVVR